MDDIIGKNGSNDNPDSSYNLNHEIHYNQLLTDYVAGAPSLRQVATLIVSSYPYHCEHSHVGNQ